MSGWLASFAWISGCESAVGSAGTAPSRCCALQCFGPYFRAMKRVIRQPMSPPCTTIYH